MALITGSWGMDLLCLVLGLVTAFFFVARYVYSYWERKGFNYEPGTSYLFGHFAATCKQTQSINDLIDGIYRSSKAAYTGIYGVFKPILFVRDPEIVRNVLIRDFQQFTDRGVHCNESYDPLSGHLFALPGQKWKNLRGKLSPTFTSGKLKAMFSTIVDTGDALVTHLEDCAANNRLVDIREIGACHSTNVIASVAFGNEVDTIKDPNNDFRKYGRQIFEPSLLNGIRQFFNFVAPKLMPYVGLKVVDKEVEHFIRSVVRQNLEYREQNKVTRKDFFQLLVQLRNTGTVQLDDQWETVIKSESQKSMTVDEMAAQTFVFFAAGFETSASTLSFCLYELAKNPDCQRRVHEELDRVLKEFNGEINYDSVTAMKYLEACIDEALRKYPIVPILNRTCVNNYKIPSTGQTIEKGVEIFIPVFAMHRDEQHYPEPMKFDPERFGEGSNKSQAARPYLPFGDGPRNCIGMRLGKMQTKVGLVLMLRDFQYALQPEDQNKEIEMNPKVFVLTPQNKINLRVTKRKTVS